MVKVAVVLAGCGHLDGAEIRESVITLLALDRAGAEVSIFAPDVNQMHVVNHLTGKEMPGESRNVLEEAARIARGKISPLAKASAKDFDALVLPGGYGAAKNLSNVATKGKNATVLPELKTLITDFLHQKKPIGAICISPAILTAAVKGNLVPTVTLGEDADGLIAGLGGKHRNCPTDEAVLDEEHGIVSCSAYMRGDATISDVAAGIEKVVATVVAIAEKSH
ncbi:MAG: isoprenoid biosynthesis protein [Rickettsiales bacterium]|jgi:enhancing lycopene biosynthesis protein 2|nr:isoprenoid biosynthesis protein [Rickettsiales bacterium]